MQKSLKKPRGGPRGWDGGSGVSGRGKEQIEEGPVRTLLESDPIVQGNERSAWTEENHSGRVLIGIHYLPN